jgi:hypothetical protein
MPLAAAVASRAARTLRLGHADSQLDGFAAIEKPIEVRIKKRPNAAVEPQPFPHAIT